MGIIASNRVYKKMHNGHWVTVSLFLWHLQKDLKDNSYYISYLIKHLKSTQKFKNGSLIDVVLLTVYMVLQSNNHKYCIRVKAKQQHTQRIKMTKKM